MDERKPAASGALSDRPFARLIYQLFRKRVTAILTVTDDTGDSTRIYLRDGVPVHAERPDELDILYRVLADIGMVPAEKLEAARAQVTTGRRLGELLVAQGLLTTQKLAEALKQQIRRKLLRLFFVRRGRFEVRLDDHAFGKGDDFPIMRLDPRCLIYPGIRAAYDDGRLRDELAPLSVFAFTLIPLPPGWLDAMGFPRGDPTIVRLSEGDTRAKLTDISPPGTKALESRAILLALLYTDLLEAVRIEAGVAPVPVQVLASMSSGSLPALGPASPTSLPEPSKSSSSLPVVTAAVLDMMPRPSSPGLPAMSGGSGTAAAVATASDIAARIADLGGKLDDLSHFELLGVPENATNAEVGAAYLRIVKQIHPDRLASLGLRDLSAAAERIVSRLSEAQGVLLDAKKRAAYVASRAGKGSPAESGQSGQSILAAEELFSRGEVYLRKGDHARAIECFDGACKLNPLEPTFRAHWAWARFDAPAAAKDSLARETIKILNEVLKERAKFPLGHFWLGQVHKQMGDMGAAERAFREALVHNRSFIDAEREIRIIEMRRSHGTPNRPASSGKSSQAGMPAQPPSDPGRPSTSRSVTLLGKILKRT